MYVERCQYKFLTTEFHLKETILVCQSMRVLSILTRPSPVGEHSCSLEKLRVHRQNTVTWIKKYYFQENSGLVPVVICWCRKNIFLKDVLQSLVTLIMDVTLLGYREETRQNSTVQLIQKKSKKK